MAKWKNLYCFFPSSYSSEFVDRGINPRRFSRSDVVTVYPSRSAVEKAMKGLSKMSLVLIDSNRLDPARLVKADYNNLFYRGSIPPNAFKLVRSNSLKKSLANIHNPDMDKVRGKLNAGSNIFKAKRRL